MRKFALFCIILLMTISVSTFNEESDDVIIASSEESSSLPLGLSAFLRDGAKDEIQQELLFQSDNLAVIALPIGYLGAEEAIKIIERDTAIQERRAKLALEAQKKEQEAKEKELLAQQQDAYKKNEVVKTVIQEEIISNAVEFTSSSLEKVQNNYAISFILRNIGEELRVGDIHFALHFANNEKISFSELGSYRFRIQVPKEYTLISTPRMLDYARVAEPLYISVTLINDNGQVFMRKNLLINKEG